MRTINFSEILHTALQLCGLDRNLTTTDRFATVRDFASRRMQTVWEQHEWPELKKFQQCPTGIVSERNKVILPADVGQVLAVWTKDPLAHNSIEKDFVLNGSDCFLMNNADQNVWVEYRSDAPKLFGEPWDTAVSYKKGAQVYFDAGSATSSLVPVSGSPVLGNFYEYTGESPSGTGSIPTLGSWQIVQIPRLFGSYLIHGVHADYQRSQGQTELATAAEADAQTSLDQALDQVLRQQGQVRRINFRNY